LLSREQLSKLAQTLQGIPVWGCLPGSLGRNAGIRYGDVLLSVNGQPTSDAAEYMAARQLRSDGLTLVVFRDGATHTLQLRFEQTAQRADEQRLRAVAQTMAESRLLPLEPPSRESGPDHS
jgi:S1-C subfamily serine protease